MKDRGLIHFRKPTVLENTLLSSMVWSSFRAFLGMGFVFVCILSLLGLLGYTVLSGFLPVVGGFFILLFLLILSFFWVYLLFLSFRSFRVRLHLYASEQILVSRCSGILISGRLIRSVRAWLSPGEHILVHTEFDESETLLVPVSGVFTDTVTENDLLLVRWGSGNFDLVRYP